MPDPVETIAASLGGTGFQSSPELAIWAKVGWTDLFTKSLRFCRSDVQCSGWLRGRSSILYDPVLIGIWSPSTRVGRPATSCVWDQRNVSDYFLLVGEIIAWGRQCIGLDRDGDSAVSTRPEGPQTFISHFPGRWHCPLGQLLSQKILPSE